MSNSNPANDPLAHRMPKAANLDLWRDPADDPAARAHDGSGTSGNHRGGVGRNSGWAAGDEEGAPFKARGDEPVRYLGAQEQLWKYTLVWLFWPSLLITLGVWWWLNNWLHNAGLDRVGFPWRCRGHICRDWFALPANSFVRVQVARPAIKSLS